MKTIKSLDHINAEQLFFAFQKAFSDYEKQWSKTEFISMLQRRGYVPELSFGAFYQNELIAFTLNGIGDLNGLKTAYDTGTGTIKEFRGEGLATRIFKHSIPLLIEQKVKQYQLEVLEKNANAINLYKGLGFKVIRKFNYFIKANENISFNRKSLPSGYAINYTSLNSFDETGCFHDFTPSWQNNFEAISRTRKVFKIPGVFYKNKLVGYIILEPETGDIPQIAVHKEHRRKGIGSILFQEALKNNESSSIKIINIQSDCTSMLSFLKALGLSISGKQIEMLKKI